MYFFLHVYIITDETFILQNIIKIVEDVEKWEILGYLLGDRNSQDEYEGLKESLSTSQNEQKKFMLEEWHQYHPYASWSLLHQALLNMGEIQIANTINEEYLKREYAL